MKRLLGRSDVEDALKKLDKLTDEEARMAVAQNLKATHNVNVRVAAVDDTVKRVGDKVAEGVRGGQDCLRSIADVILNPKTA